jgi:soluble lytic murein transglycosylase-like protein
MTFPHENDFDGWIAAAASSYNIPFALLKGIMAVESNFVQRAYRSEPSVNDASYGLMQVLLSTARAVGYTGTADGLYDPLTNISVGASFLSDLLRTAAEAGWGTDSAVSAYNAGFSSDRPGDGKRDTDRVDGRTADGSQLAPFINQSYVNAVNSYAQQYPSPGVVLAAGAGSSSLGGAVLPIVVLGALAAAVAVSRS